MRGKRISGDKRRFKTGKMLLALLLFLPMVWGTPHLQAKTADVKTGTAETAQKQTDAAKTDKSKTGTAETAPKQTDTAKADKSKTGAAETAQKQTDAAKADKSKTDGTKTDEEKTAKTCRVTFQEKKGMTESADFSGMSLRVKANTKIRLPKLPALKGYEPAGWSASETGKKPLYKPGDTITVREDLRLYAVRTIIKYVSVQLHQPSGLCYKTVRLEKGARYRIPGMYNRTGKTILGWSEEPGQSCDPQYEAGEVITVSKSMKLYPVVFDRSDEEDLTKEELLRWKDKVVGEGKTFQHVVFVGDSRTFHMRKWIRKEFVKKKLADIALADIDFVCKPGAGIDWFDEEGLPKLLELAQKGTAVIFNLGVHDLNRADRYVTYLTKLGRRLQKKGCTMFYMSVNPVNNKVMKVTIDRDRPEVKVRAFNSVLREQLCGDGLFTYIDCYSYLMQNGYGTAVTSSDGADDDDDDGLHYTTKTYKRIFNYCMYSLYRWGQKTAAK